MQSHGNKAESSHAASASGSFANIYMNGSEVFKFAVRAVPTVRLMELCNHQAIPNGRTRESGFDYDLSKCIT